MIIDTGLYKYRVQGLAENFKQECQLLYPDSISEQSDLVDFDIQITNTSWLRSLIRPQVSLSIEGHNAFNPIAPSKLLPSLEWAMNWCIPAYDHTRLLIHCGVVVKNGKAILFPAKSGSGKSTTSSFLGLRDWTLYSDEMAVINLASGLVEPMFRPTSLKNESIDIIRPFVGEKHHMSRTTEGTHKGNIAHVRTNTRARYDTLQACPIAAVVFLHYSPSSQHQVYEIEQGIGFAKLVKNAFNYSVVGEAGFNLLADIVGNALILETTYADMLDVESIIDSIVEDNLP